MRSHAAEIGDAGVSDDQLHSLVAFDELGEVVADRRQPAASVDQDRDVALDCNLEDGIQSFISHRELLGAWMKLDSAGTEVEAAPCLLDRPLVEVEPHERDDAIRMLCGVGERAVIRRRERGHPVGLVEAECERPADPDAIEHREHLVGSGAHPVDVVAKVRVRIEENGVIGQACKHPVGDLVEDLMRTVESVHPSSLRIACPCPRSPPARARRGRSPSERSHLVAQVREVRLWIDRV